MHDSRQLPTGRKARFCFRAAALFGGLFVVTVLATTAAALGDPAAPAAAWLNRHGNRVMTVEVALTVLFGFAALAFDQRETRARTDARDAESADTRQHARREPPHS